MKRFISAARIGIVAAGGVLLFQDSALVRRAFDALLLQRASYQLLYGERSPLAIFAGGDPDQVQEFTLPPRTDVAVRTPLTPFGAGEHVGDAARTRDGTFAYAVKRGETLSQVWGALGGEPQGLEGVKAAFDDAKVSLRDLKAGEQLEFTREGGRIVGLRRKLGGGATLVLSAGSEDGSFVSAIEKVRILRGDRTVRGTIESSLVDAAQAEGIPYAVIDDFVDLFSSRVEFRRDLQPGDSFSVVYEDSRTEDGEQLEAGVIKVAALQIGGKLMAVVRDVTPAGVVRYFDERGEMPTKAFLRYPVQYTRISSVFTNARFHPILRVSRPHHGVDFSAPIGTPVRTVGDGVVVAAGYSASMGNMVRIAHDDRYTTEYMHLSRIAAGIKKGARVTRGSVIGALGSTGLSTGPHLHFGMFDRGKYIDPLKAKVLQSATPGKPPAAVLAALAELKKVHGALALAAPARGKQAG